MEGHCQTSVRDCGRLIVSANSGHIRLRGPVVILGRCCRSAQLLVTGETISRCHCRILAVNGTVFIEDLNSRNGTWVNGVRIQRVPLVDGTVIHLGREQFVFEASCRRTSTLRTSHFVI